LGQNLMRIRKHPRPAIERRGGERRSHLVWE
jgi:hypothetical protein